MRVAIYARVSTTAQAEEGYSLGAQVEDCTRYAKEKLNADSIREFVDDGYSGAFLERPALEQLREELSFGAYDAVVCYDADRLARGLTTQLVITDEIEKHCKLFFCNMEYQRTPEGQLFYQIKGAFSGYEREKIKQRSMRGKLAKLKQGKPIQDFRIYGYRYINEAYVIEPSEAEVVQLIFSAYTSGTYGGLNGVCNMLNAKSIPSPQSSTWQSSTLRNILIREDYAGVHLANRIAWQKVTAHKITRTEKPQQEWLPIEMPAIISRDAFAQAQDKLKKGKMYRMANDPYIVQGIVYCGHCGRSMTTSKRDQYIYLRCISQAWTKGGSHSCGARVIPLNVFNEIFWDFFAKVCSSKKSLSAYMKGRKAPAAQDISALQKELKKVSKEKQTLIDWWHDGIVDELDIKRRLKALTAQEAAVKEKIKSAAIHDEAPQLTADEIIRIVKQPAVSIADRQRIARQVLEKVTIERMDKTKKHSAVQLAIELFFK